MELKALSRGKLVLCLQGQPGYSPERKWTYIQVVSDVKCITAVILWTCRDGNGGLEGKKKKKKESGRVSHSHGKWSCFKNAEQAISQRWVTVSTERCGLVTWVDREQQWYYLEDIYANVAFTVNKLNLQQRRLLNIYYFASKAIISDKLGSSIKALWKMVYNPLIFITRISGVKDDVIFQWLPAAICSEITNSGKKNLHLSKNPDFFFSSAFSMSSSRVQLFPSWNKY